MGLIYQNDVGKDFRVDTKETTLAQASVLKIIVVKPDGSEADWSPVEIMQTETTKLQYFTKEGELTQYGTYIGHAYGEWGSTSKHLGEAFTFRVWKKGTPVPSAS